MTNVVDHRRRNAVSTNSVSVHAGSSTAIYPALFRQVLPASLCQRLRRYLDRSEVKPRSYQGVVDLKLRQCNFALCPGAMSLEIVFNIRQSLGDVPVLLESGPSIIYCYPVGVGFVAHHDGVTRIEIERSKSNGQPVLAGDYTTVVGLNGCHEYGGGSLVFPDFQRKFDLQLGDMVVFPATPEYIHEVAPVTNGKRYSLVTRFYRIGTDVPQ